MLYFFAIGASFSTVGPGTGSAASYQRLSCDGQKYGPLKISCRQRIWTPFLPGLVDHRQVLLEHRRLDLGHRTASRR